MSDEKVNQLTSLVPATANILIMVPKLLKLLLGLFRDSRVPRYLKILTAGVVMYVALPLDFLPDFIPVTGLADDIIVIILVVIQYLKSVPPDVFREHWDAAMGENFDAHDTLKDTVAELEPLVSDKYSFIRGYIVTLLEKYQARFPKKQIPEPESEL